MYVFLISICVRTHVLALLFLYLFACDPSSRPSFSISKTRQQISQANTPNPDFSLGFRLQQQALGDCCQDRLPSFVVWVWKLGKRKPKRIGAVDLSF